jgi:hypothetical protein
MPLGWRRGRCRPAGLTPTRFGHVSPRRRPGSWRRPCWLGPATRVPRLSVSDAHSPGLARRLATALANCPASRRRSPVTARAFPKQSAAAGTTGEPRGTGPTRSSRRSRTRISSRGTFDRRGRAPLMRFVPLQHTLAAARLNRGGCQPSPDDPASAFSPPARALASQCRSAASALAVLRSRRARVGVDGVADFSGFLARLRFFEMQPTVLRTVVNWNTLRLP